MKRDACLFSRDSRDPVAGDAFSGRASQPRRRSMTETQPYTDVEYHCLKRNPSSVCKVSSKLCDSQEQLSSHDWQGAEMLREQKYSSKLGTTRSHPKPQPPRTLQNGGYSLHGRSDRGRGGTARCPYARTETIDGWKSTKDQPHSVCQLPAVTIDSFAVASVKCPDQSNLRKRGFVLVHSLRLQSTTAGTSRQ